jgi:hypothetical protein
MAPAQKTTMRIAAKAQNTHLALVLVASKAIVPAAPLSVLMVRDVALLPVARVRSPAVKTACVVAAIIAVAIWVLMAMGIVPVPTVMAMVVVGGFVN